MSGPWNELLPTSVTVAGRGYKIRSDYRAVLDICVALNDPELSDTDRGRVVLEIFYPDLETMPPESWNEAVEKCFWFLNCGSQETGRQNAPRLVDWKKDFQHIVSPINRVMGQEIRAMESLHWWTFISAYFEIGDCLFSQIVRIRSQLARGRQLDKADREWYEKNRDLVDLQRAYTAAEKAAVEKW